MGRCESNLGELGWGVGEEGAQDKDDIHVKYVRMAWEGQGSGWHATLSVFEVF